MMTIRIRVTHVDMNGYNGRDHHPQKQDEGVDGTVTNIDCEPASVWNMWEPDETPHPMMALTNGELGEQCFHVRLDNGRNVQLMGHEFDLLSCTHDGDL